MTESDPIQDENEDTPTEPARLPRLSFDSLRDGNSEILITHGDAVYRLRETSLGKLILTK